MTFKMFWIVFTVITSTWIIWTFYLKPYRYWKNMGVPQMGPWLFFGDIWPTIFRLKDLMQWMNWVYYKYPSSKYVGIYQFNLPLLVLRDPVLVKQIAVKDFDHFTDHTAFAIGEEVDPIWSKNLFALKGQKWRDMRTLLSGSFTSSKMRMMYGLFVQESEKFVNHFLKKGQNIFDLELKDSFTRYTTDVIASISFGIKVDSLENPNNEFFLMGREIGNFTGFKTLLKVLGITLCPSLFKLLKIGFISKRVQKFFCRIIDENIKAREEQDILRQDMINMLLEVRRGLHKAQENDVPDTGFAVVQELPELAKHHKKQMEITNMDIAAQSLLFFLAGFESVSMTMCYACYELALNPNIQDELRKEINDVFTKTNGKPTYEDILGMKYFDMVVTETLRKWPISPAVDRVCVEPYTIPASSPKDLPVTLKKNDIVWIPVYSFHHDPLYYPNPEKFIPERFSEENKRNIKPYTYLPFGIGPRACIGSRFALLEIKSVLLYLLYFFEVTPSDKTTIPLKLDKSAITFTPVGGFPLRLKRILKS